MDVTNKAITNTGTATGTPPSGTDVTATSTVMIPLAAISIVKSASLSSFSAAGDIVTYTYVVTNTGDALLTAVTITDPMTGLSPIACGAGSNAVASLPPGASVTCTAHYPTTQADVDVGHLTNTGTANAKAPGDVAVVRCPVHADGASHPEAGGGHRQVGQHLQLLRGGHRGDLHVRGHQHRRRHPHRGDDHRPYDGALAHRLRRRSERVARYPWAAHVTCTATYTITAADVTNKEITNTARSAPRLPTACRSRTDTSTVIIPGAWPRRPRSPRPRRARSRRPRYR